MESAPVFIRCDVTSELEVQSASELSIATRPPRPSCRPTPPSADGERGLLIHTSSVAAYDGQIGQVAYSATKAAVTGMVLPIARELAGSGIRCVAIAPGIFRTPMISAMKPELQESPGRQVPFPARLREPGEFAQLVGAIFELPYLTGETIRLDGAIRMQSK